MQEIDRVLLSFSSSLRHCQSTTQNKLIICMVTLINLLSLGYTHIIEESLTCLYNDILN